MKSAADLDLRRISRKAGNCLYFPVCHPALVSLLVRSPHFKFLYIIPVTVMMMVMMMMMMIPSHHVDSGEVTTLYSVVKMKMAVQKMMIMMGHW